MSINSRTLIADDDALWRKVMATSPRDKQISIAPGIHARMYPLTAGGRLEAGVTLEVIHVPGDQFNATPRSELEAAEVRVIKTALRYHGGNKLAAARELGISRGTLYSRIRRYHLDRYLAELAKH